ncbi:MAG TPA: bifunctional UDP-N-acetylglucosamine diphosphorylase/glucosamine-1-phosphate N-acetyltransferase GlmU [Trebonia sp.]|nr:bifunctional UDP-N-acetylglucosamine diphosphorylase/glucosamine-1-phosphate N-acetyltransferase GlmU [Trebonia sp.]
MSETSPAAVVILAAGEGTRMKSRTPKVLHTLSGRSLLGHAIAVAGDLAPERLVVVVGHAREQVSAAVAEAAPHADIVAQEQQFGTGHAVRTVIESVGAMSGTVVVTYGDMPLLRGETLRQLVDTHQGAGNAVTVLTARGDFPGFGRIVRDAEGAFLRIVEERDATAAERAIDEFNSGCYAFDGALLTDAVKRVTTDNSQHEEYLTDVVEILRGDGHAVGTTGAADPAEIRGVNDRVQLAEVRRTLNDRILRKWMLAGVTIIDPASTWIDVTVAIGRDAEIGPQTQLTGATVIGEGAKVGAGCLLEDTTVGADAVLLHAVCRQAEIGPRVTVGPFAYLRPGTSIAADAHLGTYVEVKKSHIGAGAKVPHLTYVGDATVGAGSNIGAGTIFANYDGERKHHTEVGENAFIGSNTVLVAPVSIGAGAYTAAGSAIHEDVPAGDLGIARGRQHNSDEWVLRNRQGTRSAEAATRNRSDKS